MATLTSVQDFLAAVPHGGAEEIRTFADGNAVLYRGDWRAIAAEVAADPLGVILISDPREQGDGVDLCQWAERLGLPTVLFADMQRPWPGKWRQHLIWNKGPAVGDGGCAGNLWLPSIELIQVARTGKLNGGRDEACLPFPSGSPEKPTKLLRYLIEKISQPGHTLFDPFAGSFSTAVAAIQCGRKFIGCEINEAHYATGCKRVAEELDRPLLGFDET